MKRTSTTLILLTLAAATATLLAAERSTIQYKGMAVRDPAPYGEAGLAWQNNFKALADRVGPCKFDATTPPTATDDSTAGYATGSLWLDTAANRLYWCASAATGAAMWIEVSPADLSQVYQPLDANLTTWAGVAPSANGQSLVAADDYAAMRGLLGLGTLATQGAGSVAITGGEITGITDLAVADGGTGASDAAGARSNLGFTDPILDKAAPGDIGGTDPGNAVFRQLSVWTSLGFGSFVFRAADASIYYYSPTHAHFLFDITQQPGGARILTLKSGSATATGGRVSLHADGAERAYIDPSGLSIPSDTVGLKLDAAGTTTLISNGTVATLSKPLKAAGYQAADGTAGLSQTIAIVDKSDVTHTLMFKNGLLTSYTTNP